MAEPNLMEMVERLARIETKIDNFQQVQKEVNENTKIITELREQNKNQQKEIDGMQAIVKSMADIIIELKEQQKNNQKEIDKINERSKFWFNTTIGAVIVSVVALIFAFIKIGLGV